ncbi:hypothetical protein RQP46_002691 [Phenoliferia psychrophenolica]
MSFSSLRTLAPRLRPTLPFATLSRSQNLVNLPSLRSFRTSALRSATGSVSQQPGSKDFIDLAKNAKEEAGAVAKEIGDAISGANAQTSEIGERASASESIKADLGSIAGLRQAIPKDAMLFGVAGLLPYGGTSLAAIYLAREAGIASTAGAGASGLDLETSLALLHHVELLQIQYGALILSFLGAIHWGFEWAGFNALWFVDQKATNHGWTPKWYSTYRFGLTAFVGTSILVTLGGTSYFGPGRETIDSKATKALHAVTSISSSETLKRAEEASGIKLSRSDDAFTQFTDMNKIREKEEKEAKEKEEEEKVEAEKRRKEALAK